MCSRNVCLVTIGILAAGTAHATMPRVGCELSVARSSFAHVDDRGPFEDTGRWLPRMAVVATVELPGRFRLSPMVEYVERGETNTADHPEYSEDQRLRERFLALGLQWSRPVFPRLALTAGPELAYLLDGEARGTFTSTSTGRVDYRFDYTSWGDRVDVLARLGLEAELPTGRHALTLHGRYVLGITVQNRPGSYVITSQRNVAWTANPAPFDMSRSRTRAVELGVGLHW